MKIILLTILIFSYSFSFSQNENTDLYFLLGAKTRITPIYLRKVPDIISLGNINTLEQPDKHLSGPGLQLTERKWIGKKWSVAIHQVLRYDYIYQAIPLEANPPNQFEYKIKQKLIIDIYSDIAKTLFLKNSLLRLSAGLGICGLNSGFYETKRIYQTMTTYTDYETKKNFIFKALTTGVGWQKNNFYSELKIGYCWNNPTLYNTPFLFPEISFQYQLNKSK